MRRSPRGGASAGGCETSTGVKRRDGLNTRKRRPHGRKRISSCVEPGEVEDLPRTGRTPEPFERRREGAGRRVGVDPAHGGNVPGDRLS